MKTQNLGNKNSNLLSRSKHKWGKGWSDGDGRTWEKRDMEDLAIAATEKGNGGCGFAEEEYEAGEEDCVF